MEIITEKCIGCSRCVRICPAAIFKTVENHKAPVVVDAELCIECGHCVGVCPQGAVAHECFPANRTHKIEYASYPTPQQMMTIIAGRRSNRAFSKEPIPIDKLHLIARAAHLAPTASNLQGISYTLITTPEELRKISDYTMTTFTKLYRLLTNPLVQLICKPFMRPLYHKYVPSFGKMIEAYKEGVDPVLRGATAVLLIHANKGSRFGVEDTNLAYQNGSLMAESLGISQFYTGFVLTALKRGKGKLERELEIEGRVMAGMALGMPSFRYENYVDRKDIKLTVR